MTKKLYICIYQRCHYVTKNSYRYSILKEEIGELSFKAWSWTRNNDFHLKITLDWSYPPDGAHIHFYREANLLALGKTDANIS